MSARFEVVRTDAGWHARFRAANGRIVWTTENYTRRYTALRAIWAITGAWPGRVHSAALTTQIRGRPTEVRDVDERTQ